MDPTIVHRLFREYEELAGFLRDAEPSMLVAVDDAFRKVLLLSAASHCERVVIEAIMDFIEDATGGSVAIKELVQNKVLMRQYHTLFDWNAPNVNVFLKLFGQQFGERVKSRLSGGGDLASAVLAFLELGRERNRMIHGDLGQFVLEKTAPEIFDLAGRALVFVDALPELFRVGAGLNANEFSGRRNSVS